MVILVKFFQQVIVKHPCIALYGLRPVLLKELVNDANRSENQYTLLLDETATKQVTKQKDLSICYLSIIENQALIRYLNSRFFGHVKEDDLCKKVIDVLEKYDLDLTL